MVQAGLEVQADRAANRARAVPVDRVALVVVRGGQVDLEVPVDRVDVRAGQGVSSRQSL